MAWSYAGKEVYRTTGENPSLEHRTPLAWRMHTHNHEETNMTIAKIIRAWEDPEYRRSLSAEERATLPENPVGQLELTEDELTEVMGAVSGASTGCNTRTCTRGNSANPCRGCQR
jgi:mersacidin/lichenicidin family type 2 lantibiotic